MRIFKYLKNNTLELHVEACIGCGRCLEVCPHAVFVQDGKKVKIMDKELCMECGACQMNCPVDAISVDAGVGCAAAVIYGTLTGSEPTCGCSTGDEGGASCC